MNYTGPKVRISRRLGIAVTPKAVRFMEKREYPPGEHGVSKRPRQKSVYAGQLLEKQRLRSLYNIHERAMRNYYKKASARHGSTSEELVRMLETRLDAVVLRGGLARSIYAARQYVAHGLITVNGKRVDKPGAAVKEGDVVSIKNSKKDVVCFEEAVAGANPPVYLELNRDEKSVTLKAIPSVTDIPSVRDLQLAMIVEYYSR